MQGLSVVDGFDLDGDASEPLDFSAAHEDAEYCCRVDDVVPMSEASMEFNASDPCCTRCKLRQACRTLAEHSRSAMMCHLSEDPRRRTK